MAKEIRQFTQVDRSLPSRTGRICRVLCLLVVGAVASGCAADDGNDATCEAPSTLRIERVFVPTNNATARESAFDLDGDKAADNQLGAVAGALASQIEGFDLSAAATRRLASDVTWQIALAACDDGSVRAAIGPDVTELALAGERDGDLIRATGGGGALPLSTLFDPTTTYPLPGWLRGARVALELEPLADGSWQGRVGMALDPELVTDAVVRPIAPYFDEHRIFVEYLDRSPKDGRITVEEMLASSYVKTLLAPDIELDRDHDAISFGLRFLAR